MQTTKQLSVKGFFLPAIALCSLLLSGNAAYAALVTYSFTGSVSNVNGPLTPTVNMMSPVSGTFEFDNSPAVGGTYNGVVSNLTLNIGGYTSTFAPGANSVSVFQAIPLGGGMTGDRWQLVTAATGSAINGYSPFRFDLNLDKEGSLFANTNMQNPPSLGNPDFLTGARWRLLFENSDGVLRVQGALASLTAVPLPAAVILFGAGLISLVGLGAGGLRNLRRPQA
ncbi:MAG TPA: hypothetical protein VGQ79_08485 [Nitrospiraceae bacterium]|jgi:hypothetical protein|nr:hypothetical protein [Nitrospiraceae bacterium]